MPKDIIARLIVRQHGLLESPPVMWKRGAVLSDKGARVEVMESYRDKRISLRSDSPGRNAKELITTISREIDALNRGFHFNERMKVEQKIPCHCAVCKEMTTPHYFSRSYLDRVEQANKTAQCGLSVEDINVRELLDGVFAHEMGAKGSKFDKDSILEWIEQGELQKALEAMKIEYPEVSIHLGNLKEAEKANQQGRLSFERLAETKALLKFAALEMLKPKQ